MRLVGVATFVAAAVSVLLLAGCASDPPEVPAGITAAQARAATRQDLDVRWSEISAGSPDLKRPRVTMVRYTNYLDSGPTIAACLRRAGYTGATWTSTGGVVDPNVPAAAGLVFRVETYICQARYPENPLELGYLSDAQEQYLYSYWGNETVPCLREQGVAVANLPPVDQYGEGYEDVGELNPYDHARFNGMSEQLLYARCPPYPGELYAAHK